MNTSYRSTGVDPPAPSGLASRESRQLTAQQPDHIVWIDLSDAVRLTLDAARERYDLPLEVMTYFLLRYQSAKLIHAGSALFLVTFLAAPSLRHLFTTRALKICVTPTRIVTLCESSGRTPLELRRSLPLLSGLDTGGAGRFLCSLLAVVVESYAGIVKTVQEQCLESTPRVEQQQWRKRVEKLIRCLRDTQGFLRKVAHEGKKLFADEEGQRLQQLEEQIGALARATWETLQPQRQENGALVVTRSVKKGTNP
ncbi:MAG: CorA family divalent cation transporter [Candidatus Binatia bacterium]